MICKSCGKEVKENINFCPVCGTRMGVSRTRENKLVGSDVAVNSQCWTVDDNQEQLKRQKNLKNISIVACVVATIIVIALALICANFYINKNSEDESHGSGDDTTEQTTGNNQDNGATSDADAQNQQSQQQTEEEARTQKIEALTQQIKDAGYSTVLSGEVKEHLDQFSGTTYVTYYIKLDEASNICGYSPGGVGVKPTTKTTQTIIASPNYKSKFANEDAVHAFFSKMKGKKVLVGFNDGTEEIAWPGGVPCNMTLHSQDDCELMNTGIPAYMRDLEVLEID